MIQIPSHQKRKRRLFDGLCNGVTYLSSGLSVFVLTAIFVFIFSEGFSSLGTDLLKGNYWFKNYLTSVETMKNHPGNFERPSSLSEEASFPSKWEIGFVDIKDQDDNAIALAEYIDEASPSHYMKDESIKDKDVSLSTEVGFQVKNLGYRTKSGATMIAGNIMSQNAAEVAQALDSSIQSITKVYYKIPGGGIRGSIISALYLMLISLLISPLLGAVSAIYPHEHAEPNRLISLIRSATGMLTGVPSVTFGLMRVIVLSPITQLFGVTTTSILLGSFTMSIIPPPTIIRSTEEALIVVPQFLWDASSSVGANQSQTTFKVVLPCAVPGILTSVLPSIGRTIGESAALIYTMGTYVDDTPTLMSQGISLVMHTYNIMSSEQPNFELVSATSIVTLVFVLISNICVKLLSKKFSESWYQRRNSYMKKEPVSHAEHPNLFYEEKRALKDIGVDIEQSKITVLTEPSGCGKSTFLCCPSRMNDLIEGCRIDGAIELNGVDAYGSEMNVVDLRTQVGMVFQKPNPFPMSIYDNITYRSKYQGIKNRKTLDVIVEQPLREVAPWEEVKDRLNDSAFGLSGGQQQRLYIARAIAMEPEVILMDESTSALDSIATNKIEDLMKGLKKDYTIVIVMHSMQQVSRVSDYIASSLLGKIVELSKTSRVFQQPCDKRAEDCITGRFGWKEEPMIKIDEELGTMEENVLRMGQKVVRIHERVVQALNSPNKEIELEIVQSDDIINHLEEEINDQAVRSLALLSLAVSDLHKVVVDIKIASELECIGDYTKNISISLTKHDDMDASIPDYARAMEKGFIAMLQETMTRYESRDIDTAFEIPEKDKEINVPYKELKEKIRHDDPSYLVEHIFEISSMLRNTERAGDHTKNTCGHIIYMIKRQHYDFGQMLRFA